MSDVDLRADGHLGHLLQSISRTQANATLSKMFSVLCRRSAGAWMWT